MSMEADRDRAVLHSWEKNSHIISTFCTNILFFFPREVPSGSSSPISSKEILVGVLGFLKFSPAGMLRRGAILAFSPNRASRGEKNRSGLLGVQNEICWGFGFFPLPKRTSGAC